MTTTSTPRARKLYGGAVATILVAAFAFQSAAPAEGAMSNPSPRPTGGGMTWKEFSKKCRKKGGTPVKETSNGHTTWRCEIFISRTAPHSQPESVGPSQAVSR
jgi:hypothetical protein